MAARTVETAAGVGQQFCVDADSGPAREARLSSPGDVLYLDGVVYIAMAGKHQLWTYDPESEWMEVFAGSGVEELDDGPHLNAGLNQPTALTADDSQHLYVADSEASAIRRVDLDLSGVVKTLVSQGFWEFGDVDGVGDEVRMQRPAGIAYQNGLLYVADTYNNKIKTLDSGTREARTFLGTGESGWRDGNDPLFNEPIGLSVSGDKLYIADANNHVIRVADLTAEEVSTLVLSDPEGLLTRWQPDTQAEEKTITLDPQTVAPGEGVIRLDVTLPADYQVNELAPARFTWQSEGDAIVVSGESAERVVVEPAFPQVFDVAFAEGATTLTGEAVIYYCQKETKDLCLIEQARFVVPVMVAAGAEQNTIEIDHTVTLP